MEIKQLTYFQTCAELQSLTKAAEVLYTTQPHVSMVIRALENELGVQLFHRKSKGVELTDAGKRIYDYSANLLKNAALITAAAHSGNQLQLKIATNPSSNMAALLARFYTLNRASDFCIDYTQCGIERMIALVSDKAADLGFIFVADNKSRALQHLLKQKRLVFESLLLTDMVLYVGRNHPLYGQSVVAPDILKTLKYVQLRDDYFTLEDLLESLAPKSQCGFNINRAVVTNSDHAMIQLLKQSDLANLGSYWLKDVYRQYDFERIKIHGFEKKVTFGIISREGESLPDLADSFLDFVRHVLQRENTKKSELV